MLEVVGILVKIGLVAGIALGAVAYLILIERKVAAWAQDRLGPNRAGPLGVLQAIIDGLKLAIKEDVVPNYVNKPLFILAPMLAFVAALIGLAIIPFGPVGPEAPRAFWLSPFLDPGQVPQVNFQIAPGVDLGIVYVFAIGSLGVYGVILAGWSSNNKYSFLGGLRSSAQLISYEIPLGMSILGIVLLARSLDLNTIVNWQDGNLWGIFYQPIGFLIFMVSAFAETNRLPFDLPESEQELVGGFHTEYSALKWGMFFLGEYLHVITVSFLIVCLFFGGWSILPFVETGHLTGWGWALVKMAIMLAKVAFFIFFIMWVRWTLPRFRYDTLMDLAWKSLIPLALLNLVVTASFVQLVRSWTA